MRLQVVSVGESFWRCGRRFTKAPSIVEVTEAEAEVLRAEQRLVVKTARADAALSDEEQQLLDLRAAARGEAERALRAEFEPMMRRLVSEQDKTRKACDELAAQLADARERALKAELELETLTRPAASEVEAKVEPASARSAKK